MYHDLAGNNHKIGVGILTCNRPDYFELCCQSFNDNTSSCDELIIVNDYPKNSVYADNIRYDIMRPIEYRNHSKNMGVSYSKNEIISYLISKGCEHIFIIEDDIQILPVMCGDDVFIKYIQTADISGIHHFCCGSFLPSRGDSILTFKYPTNNAIDVYHNCAGSFTYYSRYSILTCGLFDENYWNALEHVDLTYRISKAGLTTPFGFFADISNSNQYITSIGGEFNNSCINTTNNKRVDSAFTYFKHKFGKGFPDVYESTKQDCIQYIQTTYTTKNTSISS